MLLLLQHMLWDLPDQKEALRTLIIELVVSGGIDTEKLENEIESLQKIIESEKEILNEEKLPVEIYVVDNSRTQLTSYHQIVKEYKNNNGVKFSFNNSPYFRENFYSFSELIEKLKSDHGFIPKEGLNSEKRLLYQKEFQSLEDKYLLQRKFVKETYDYMKKDLDTNIWLTAHDIDETTHVQQQILNKIFKLEERLDTMRKLFKS